MSHSAENDAPDLVAWVMPREDARDLLRWLRHNRPLGMPDRTFDGLMDVIAGPACVLPPERRYQASPGECLDCFGSEDVCTECPAAPGEGQSDA